MTRTRPRSTCRTAAGSEITVLPPDVNESVQNFASVGRGHPVRPGRVCATSARMSLQSIINARNEKGKYTDFSDYLNKIDIGACNKKVTESLIKAGAFDSARRIRARACSWCTPTRWTRCWAPRRPRRWVSSTFSAAPTPAAPTRFSPSRCPTRSGRTSTSLPSSARCWASTYPGHPLNGVAHLLAMQVDTQIPAILDGEVANEGPSASSAASSASVNRRVNKNRLALGVSPIGRPHRRYRGAVLSADVLDVRRGDRRRRGGVGQGEGRRARRPDRVDRPRAGGPGLLQRAGGPSVGGEPADAPVHQSTRSPR